jgi:pyruvate,water dikinase
MSDFKKAAMNTPNLIGGKYFEPDEENPMIGFRGASRYYSNFIEKVSPRMRSDEKKCATKWDFTIKLMIPFCRTFEEDGEKY